jgi:hypothetical protein
MHTLRQRCGAKFLLGLQMTIAFVAVVCVGLPVSADPNSGPCGGPGWQVPTSAELAEAALDCDPLSWLGLEEESTGNAAIPTGNAAIPSEQMTDGILAVPTIANPIIQFFCWAALDEVCTDDYRVAVGTAYGIIENGGNTWGAENFVDATGSGCGSGEYFGQLDNSKDLVVYLEGVMAIDETTNGGGCVVVRITASEYATDDCSGSVTRGPYTDEVEFASNDARTLHGYAYCDDRADCAGAEGDTCDSDWHLPDVLFSANSLSGDYSYEIAVQSKVCDYDCSSNCTAWDSKRGGCFYVDWQ